MKINWKALFICIITALMSFTADYVHAKSIGNIDVVLVMDSSGSMKITDPASLRIPAAKLFISLLDKNDRASVVSFSDKSCPLIQLTPVDNEKNKDQLFKAAEKITSAGMFTNLYDALSAGLDILSENGERSKIIVLMSDGMMDVGDAEKDRELVGRLRNETATALEEKGIKVYSIAFTEQSDRLLLDKISKQTGGFFNLALSDNDFHLIFTSIFESLKRPDMLPMSEKGFLIDSSIEEVTIVATKATPQARIHLNAPDGRIYSDKEKYGGIEWFVSDNFDMITIKSPAAGRWEILFSTGENNKAYVITNLKLQTDFNRLYSTFGDPLDIRIWLEKDGITITEQDVLNKFNIYIELTGPDGQISKLQPFNKGGGIFVRGIAPFSPGDYKLRIAAKGNTFERERTFVFNIADAKESREDILVRREKERKVEEHAKIMSVKNDITDNISWKKVISQFVAVNLVCGIIVLIYFKRKRIKNIFRSSESKSSTKREKAGGQNKHIEQKKEYAKNDEYKSLSEQIIPAETIKQAEDERQKQDVALDARGGKKDIGDKEPNVTQKEESRLKNQDMGKGINQGDIWIEQTPDSNNQKREIVHEKDIKEPDKASDNGWRSIDNNQHILKQEEDLKQLLQAGKNEGIGNEHSEKATDVTSADLDKGSSELTMGKDYKQMTDDNVQDNQQEDTYAIWQEALQQQKAEQEASNVKKESVSSD